MIIKQLQKADSQTIAHQFRNFLLTIFFVCLFFCLQSKFETGYIITAEINRLEYSVILVTTEACDLLNFYFRFACT